MSTVFKFTVISLAAALTAAVLVFAPGLGSAGETPAPPLNATTMRPNAHWVSENFHEQKLRAVTTELPSQF